MSTKPYVYPSVDQSGIALQTEISAIFDFALESGNVNKHNCFLIKKKSEYLSNAVEPIRASVSLERLDNETKIEGEIFDYGETEDKGQAYSSKIVIKPSAPLEENSEYSAVLSREISALSVFDVKASETNTGATPRARGPFTGFSEDLYVITVTQSGDEKEARYSWARESDSSIGSNLTARKRYLEMDSGVFVKFGRGDYVQGDIFTIRVRPEYRLNETFAWNFSTGDSAHEVPEDEKSSTIINLPINGASESAGTFNLLSVSPYDGETMKSVGSRGVAIVNGIVFETKDYTDTYSTRSVKIIEGAALTLYEVSDDVIFEIIPGVTINQNILDLLANSSIGLTAKTSLPTTLTTTHTSGVTISGGANRDQIVFEFNKNIDKDSFNKDSVKITLESLTDLNNDIVDFNFEIVDNKLKINIL